jgi:Zn-dependent M28 family amino/carboxypeptidase
VRGTPGADDNASGCVVNLMVARRGLKLHHTVVHAFFDDEEGGLNGSEACIRQSLGAKSVKHDFMVNLDMVGRLKPAKYLDPFSRLFRKYPWARSVTLRAATEDSDHYPFAKRGVPFVFIFTGLHADYHGPTDTPDKINEDGLRMIADYVCDMLKQFDDGVDLQWYQKLQVTKTQVLFGLVDRRTGEL